jgi:hypothetical protein
VSRPRSRAYIVLVMHDGEPGDIAHGPYRTLNVAVREAERLNQLAERLDPDPNGPREMVAQVVCLEGGPVRLADYR